MRIMTIKRCASIPLEFCGHGFPQIFTHNTIVGTHPMQLSTTARNVIAIGNTVMIGLTKLSYIFTHHEMSVVKFNSPGHDSAHTCTAFQEGCQKLP